jgi:deoxyhypusine synthase
MTTNQPKKRTKQSKNNIIETHRKLHNGYSDGLEPLEALDLNKIKDFDGLARAMSKTAFGGRALGEAADVLYEMASDPDCFVVGTFAGAMTPAKMGLLIVEMIDRGIINAVISTGALMTHGLVETTGMSHFKYKMGQMNDKKLYEMGYDRIYDILELEKNLDDLESIVFNVFKNIDPKEIVSSRTICEKIGRYLKEKTPGRGILKSAFNKNTPVYIPALTDSELGLDFALFNRLRKKQGKKPLRYNPFLDLEHFAELILKQKKIGIFTIGGGVPRNWGQQVGPYLDLITHRVGEGGGYVRYNYGVRICPEPVEWGGLSGCTYSEGVSWGKFVPPEEGGRLAEVPCDATIAWPIILKAVIERLENNKKK